MTDLWWWSRYGDEDQASRGCFSCGKAIHWRAGQGDLPVAARPSAETSGGQRVSKQDNLILIAGRYEGIDERFIETYVDEEWSIGDYVLSGGELPAMVLIDAVTRLLPGALNHADSAKKIHLAMVFSTARINTRPVRYAGKDVPEVLLSGNHEHIRRWRLQQALGRTAERRADLLDSRSLSGEEKMLLDEYFRQQNDS